MPKRSKARSSVGTLNQPKGARASSTMMSATCDVLQWHQVASLEALLLLLFHNMFLSNLFHSSSC